MEVEIKKVKLTKSIIDQSLYISYSELISNFDNYDILGYVNIKHIRTVLLYDKVKNILKKMRFVDINRDNSICLNDEKQQFTNPDGGYIYRTGKQIYLYFSDLRFSNTLSQGENESVEDIEIEFEKI